MILDIRQVMMMKKQLSNVVTRAVVQTVKQDGGKIFLQITGRANQVREGVEHLQQYGFRSMPLPGSRGIAHSVGGRLNNCSVATVDDKRFGATPTYEPGESRQYDNEGGHHRIFTKLHRLQGDAYEFRIDDDNKIEFVAGNLKFTVGGEVYTFTSAKLQTTTADIVADTISLKTHPHLGSPSAPDGPVTNTGLPQ